MNRREAIAAVALLATTCRATAQPATRIPRVGVLHAGTSKEPPAVQREPFERGMRELGWVPGKSVLIEYRYAEGNAAKLPELAAELVRSSVDVIVARAAAAINAARKATRTIPIVMSAYPGDPVADGLVEKQARPGGNVTGISAFPVELDAKRLELLKDTFPQVTRVGVVANPNLDGGKYEERMAALTAHARRLKLEIRLFEIKRADEIGVVFAGIGQARVHALLVRGDPQILDPARSEIAAMAAKHRLPAVYWFRFFVEAGGLMSYGESVPGFHYRSASYVNRILRGAKAGELAIEQPATFEMAVNLKTAKALGIELPKAVLFRADVVIQ